MSKKDVESLKKELIMMRALTHSTQVRCIQIIKSSEAMQNFAKVSESQRKIFSSELKEAASKNDLLSN